MTSGEKLSFRADRLSNRILSAMVMVPAGLAVVYFGGAVLVMACLVCGLGMWAEYWTVTVKRTRVHPAWIGGAAAIFASCLSFGFFPDWIALITLVGFGLASLLAILTKSHLSFWLIIGLMLIMAAVLSLIFIRESVSQGLVIAIAVMVCVWATDIAAYFAGKGFGGPQLSPTGSPNKTWSGAAGAVICSALIGVLIAGILHANLIAWLVFAASLSVISQLGDLLQSYWKRFFKVKDSGNLIPGHGGILDRLDSFSVSLICVGLLVLLQTDFPVDVLGLEGA